MIPIIGGNKCEGCGKTEDLKQINFTLPDGKQATQVLCFDCFVLATMGDLSKGVHLVLSKVDEILNRMKAGAEGGHQEVEQNV